MENIKKGTMVRFHIAKKGVTPGKSYEVVAVANSAYFGYLYIIDDNGKRKKVRTDSDMFEVVEDRYEKLLAFAKQIEHFMQYLDGSPERDKMYERDRDAAIREFLDR